MILALDSHSFAYASSSAASLGDSISAILRARSERASQRAKTAWASSNGMRIVIPFKGMLPRPCSTINSCIYFGFESLSPILEHENPPVAQALSADSQDLALLSAGAEIRFASGLSFGAKFDGEFANRSQTYAGTGSVRYLW